MKITGIIDNNGTAVRHVPDHGCDAATNFTETQVEIFHAADYLSPRRILYWRWLLWRSQYYPPEQLQALQWSLFSRILKHCFDKVPYYRGMFDRLGLHPYDFKSLDDLRRIPILGKRVLFDRNDEFMASDIARYRAKKIHTSGTTGASLGSWWDIDSNVLEFCCQWRQFAWANHRLGQSFLDIRNYRQHASRDYVWDWKCRALQSSSHYFTCANIAEWSHLLRKHRITTWRGHPTALDHIARLLSKARIDDLRPRSIVSVGEALLDNQREYLEAWAGTPVCDNYGLMEHTAMICQCSHGGYHIASEYGIVELIKDDGSAAGPGEEGRIVSTTLHNRAFPLLRYDTQDYAVQSDRRCPCGRTLPLVERIAGRADDRVLNSRGEWIAGLHIAVSEIGKGIRCSQIVQNETGALDIYVVPSAGYSQDIRNTILLRLKRQLGEGMTIGIHEVEDVPYKGRKKSRFVVSNLRKASPGITEQSGQAE